MKKVIVIVAALVLLIGTGIGAWLFLSGDSAEEEVAEEVAEEAHAVAEVEKLSLYLPLDPAFVVTFTQGNSLRYLQVSIQVMSYDQQALDNVQHNMPAVRNNLILLLNGQDFVSLGAVEAKEALRQQVLAEVRRTINDSANAIEDVYFTSFVMQ